MHKAAGDTYPGAAPAVAGGGGGSGRRHHTNGGHRGDAGQPPADHRFRSPSTGPAAQRRTGQRLSRRRRDRPPQRHRRPRRRSLRRSLQPLRRCVRASYGGSQCTPCGVALLGRVDRLAALRGAQRVAGLHEDRRRVEQPGVVTARPEVDTDACVHVVAGLAGREVVPLQDSSRESGLGLTPFGGHRVRRLVPSE